MNQSVRLHRYITDSVLYRYLPPTLVQRAAAGELRLDTPPSAECSRSCSRMCGLHAAHRAPGSGGDRAAGNRYLAEIRISPIGATIDKFIGDCVMIVFGAPSPGPREQAERCVALAVAIHERVGDLEMEHPLQARTGISTGEAVVSSFGSRALHWSPGPRGEHRRPARERERPRTGAAWRGDRASPRRPGGAGRRGFDQLKGVREPVTPTF